MAWERTALSAMAVGVLMARVGASIHVAIGLLGVVQVCAGAGLLVWSGWHYDDLHGRLRAGEPPTHPAAVVLLGVGTAATTLVATALVLLSAVASDD